MSKSVIDSTLLTAVVGALLYFAGVGYYSTFFVMQGIPPTEFLPAAPLIVDKAAEILLQLLRVGIWYWTSAVAAAFVLRVARSNSPKVKRITDSLLHSLRPLSGWPTVFVAILGYGFFAIYCYHFGIEEADGNRTSVAAAHVTVYLEKHSEGRPSTVVGRILAESPTSYAVSDDTRQGWVVIIPKANVTKIESSGANIGI